MGPALSLHSWLIAEQDFPGLWPHRGKADRGRAESVLHVAGLSPDDATPARPSVCVRMNVAAWRGFHELHQWVEKKAGPLEDCQAKWLDREVLDELLAHATEQLAIDDDAEGNWGATVLQLMRVLGNQRLRGCAFYYEASM